MSLPLRANRKTRPPTPPPRRRRPSHSARLRQAVVRQVPGVSSPLAQTLPSGIARTEQLLLVHRHLDLPFVPSYVARHGGWVLDRVLHTLGSRGTGWWTTITARLRAQQALQQHVAGGRYVLLDPRNYALSCRAKSLAGPLGTLQGTVEFESLQQLSRLVNGEEDELPPPPQVRSTLRRGLLGGHELRGEVALHGHYRTNTGEELEIPRVISLDVASDKRQGGIRYQAGAYHTVSKIGGAVLPGDVEAGEEGGPKLERRDFFQAALSMEQEFSIWKQPRATGGIGSGVAREGTGRVGAGAGLGAGAGGGDRGGAGSPGGGAAASSARNFPWEHKEELTKADGVPVTTPRRRFRRPINALLSRPNISVSGVVGGMAQAPLRPTEVFRDAKEARERAGAKWLTLTESIAQSSKRLFGSACLNVQLGGFTRNFLDYTSLSVRWDAGLPVTSVSLPWDKQQPMVRTPSASDLQAQISECMFAKASSRHSSVVSCSLSQQIVGPLRFRVDSSYDAHLREEDLNIEALKSRPAEVLRRGFTNLETVYGVDVTIPGSSGGARFVVWYSPSRKEGMGELRLL